MRRALAASLLLVALAVAACGGSSPSSSAGAAASTSAPSVAASQPAASAVQPSAATPVPSNLIASLEPSPSPVDTASLGPTASDTPTDAPSPTPSASPNGAASACQPAGSNPNFWPGIAQSVSWDVYCAVLPKGWTVTSGKYRLANGGWLVITYKGPGGGTLQLSEGSFCTDGSGCVPSGSDGGAASFGAMAGTLVTTDAGGFAVVAARGQQPSWLMVTGGLDQTTTTSLAAALALVH